MVIFFLQGMVILYGLKVINSYKHVYVHKVKQHLPTCCHHGANQHQSPAMSGIISYYSINLQIIVVGDERQTKTKKDRPPQLTPRRQRYALLN